MSAAAGDEEYLGDFEEYNINQDKFLNSGHSGKGRSKREVAQHTNQTDPGGHTRKTVQKLINNDHKQHDATAARKSAK